MTAAWVSAAAAVAALIVARWPGRFLWHLLRRTTDFLDDWQGEPERPGVPARPGVLERLRNVEKITADVRAETHVNGPGNLRAAIQAIRKDVADVRKEQAAVRADLLKYHKEGTPK
jgi:hypothetical protein